MRKKPVTNPHDTFFRRTLREPRRLAEFLRLYLLQELVVLLDLSSIALSAWL